MSSVMPNPMPDTGHPVASSNEAVGDGSHFAVPAKQPSSSRRLTRSRSGMEALTKGDLPFRDAVTNPPYHKPGQQLMDEVGCFICRLRRKKCGEEHPACESCTSLRLKCEYKKPAWWSNAEQRRIQKERIKEKIRETKVMERDGSLQGEHGLSPV